MKKIIEATEEFVKNELHGAEGGHDWWHIVRVVNNAKLILKSEQANELTVLLAAYLHDIADAKFHNGDEEIGPQKAKEFMQGQNIDPEIINHVVRIIENISFKRSKDPQSINSIEFYITQDADRLDAIGAIGVARTFTYGGFKGKELYNPNIKPKPDMSKEEYKKGNGPTINHFYEKLLLLKDLMNTDSAKKIAEKRHEYMEEYLEQFYAEWNGER